MSETTIHTTDDFQRALEDGDRWIELEAGRLVRLSPPDEQHGNVVRNLSKLLSGFFREHQSAYSCFELALVLARDPDTIRCPAISCFPFSAGFEELDRLVTSTRPELVIEVASSNDRREGMSQRVLNYRDSGVPDVWVFDPQSLHAHVFHAQDLPRMLKPNEILHGHGLLSGFHTAVGDLFADPEWMK